MFNEARAALEKAAKKAGYVVREMDLDAVIEFADGRLCQKLAAKKQCGPVSDSYDDEKDRPQPAKPAKPAKK